MKPLPLLALALALTAPALADAPRRVLVISLDGMRPDFYQSSAWNTPNLKRLVAEGASARSMTPVFPTVTYVNHTTLVTGVRPFHHGIFGNEKFDWERGPLKPWNWEYSLIQAPTVFSLARAAHLSTEAYSWPVSVGAPVDYLMPEIFQVPGMDQTSEQLIRKNSTPGLLDEAHKLSPGPFPTDFGQLDLFVTRGFLATWKAHAPRMAFLHLINADWLQHQKGPDAAETHRAVEEVDREIGMVAAAVDPKTTTLLVVGDHGFQPMRSQISLNHLFLERGWIRVDAAGAIQSWTVIAQTHGGGAAIFCKDPTLEAEVQKLLRSRSKGLYRMVSRAQLDRLETFPRALCAVSALPGFALQGRPDKPFQEEVSPPRGQHGHLPEYVPTGIIAWGRGVRRGKDLGTLPNVNVAPTVCRILGLPTDGMEGKPIDLGG